MKELLSGRAARDGRVGVVLCSCAETLGLSLDLSALEERTGDVPGAVFLGSFAVLCSEEGRGQLRRQLAAAECSRLVIGGCSPLEHGGELREAAENAGLNPYLVQFANLREQCAWTTADREDATRKGWALLAAAIERVCLQEPLTPGSIEADPAVLVVGGGVSGLATAHALAGAGRPVFLVERTPYLGGRAYRYEEHFPSGECGACVLGDLIDEVLHHPQIEVIREGRVTRCAGTAGHFQVEVEIPSARVEWSQCLGCGACTEACPVTIPAAGEAMERKAIEVGFPGALPHAPAIDRAHCLLFRGQACHRCAEVCPCGAVQLRGDGRETPRKVVVGAVVLATGFDLFESGTHARFGGPGADRILSAPQLEARLEGLQGAGKTEGRLVLVHCVGSRSRRFHSHCSGVCCGYLAKLGAQLRQREPDVELCHLYVDLCLPGPEVESAFQDALAQSGAALVRRYAPDDVELVPEAEGVRVRYRDVTGLWTETGADLVVLAPAMVGGRSAQDLIERLGLERDAGGFIRTPPGWGTGRSSQKPGVFVAGCATGPMGIQRSAESGLAAAARVLASVVPGRQLELEAATAVVDRVRCSGCAACLAACDVGALSLDGEGVAVNDETLCRGCGSCVTACPSGVMEQHNSTDPQLRAEIRALSGA